MPQSIPAGLTREHVLKALAELDAGIDHPFGTPTGYELVHEDRRYAPKAVIGLACRYSSLGRMLQPDEFSGGEGPGQANYLLRKLGFTVVKKSEDEPEPQTGKDWTKDEVRLIVADYFEMLETELRGAIYSKSAHRKALAPQLSGRSEGSIEFKHQNISAVLVEMGLPYIEGYKPRGNFQALLADEVESFLAQQPDFLESLAKTPVLNPEEPMEVDQPILESIIEAPPERLVTPSRTSKPWVERKPRKIDFAHQDASNRNLGNLGEQFVFDLERHRLNQAGRNDLANKVLWASRDIGDGKGFDIISFEDFDWKRSAHYFILVPHIPPFHLPTNLSSESTLRNHFAHRRAF